MIDKQELIRWLNTLPEDADVAIDEGGLTLVEVEFIPNHNPDYQGPYEETGAYLEVGGIPLGDEDED